MAAVRHYADARAFARVATPFLARQEALNSLPLRIAGALAKLPAGPKPDTYLAACFASAAADAPITGVAVRTPPMNLVLSGPCSGEALAAFAADVPAAGLPGVIGPAEEARAFSDRWRQACGGSAVTTMSLRVYELTRVRLMGEAEGELRSANEEDVPLLTEWEQAFHREAVPDAPIPTEPLDLDGFFVWTVGERVVSTLRARSGTPTGAVVNAVYTPPEWRRRGYATAAVAEASALMLRRGFRRCVLFTDLANPTSNSIYQRIGYEPVGDFQQIKFTRDA